MYVALSKQKRADRPFRYLYGGERGIRTPGGLTLNGFQDRRFRPLSQLSGFYFQHTLCVRERRERIPDSGP